MQNKLPEWIRVKQLNKINTFDLNGHDNGFLVDILNRNDEIFSDRQSELFQQVYYSTVYANMFKGFHIHPYKYDSVTCLIGNTLLVFYPHEVSRECVDKSIAFEDLIIIELDTESKLQLISFPSKYPHGYYGVSEISYILNYRDPAWNPSDKHQYDMKISGIEEYLNLWVKKHANG